MLFIRQIVFCVYSFFISCHFLDFFLSDVYLILPAVAAAFSSLQHTGPNVDIY